MEEKVEQAYLYDFYGELLNEHQRRIYEDFIFNDLSLGEIASCEGISRQGVHDLIKRCNKLLAGYEEAASGAEVSGCETEGGADSPACRRVAEIRQQYGD